MYTIHFKDTLSASQSILLYNNIQLKNLTPDSLQLRIEFDSPPGWDIISQHKIVVSIPPYQDFSLPVSLKKRNNNSLLWQQVNISVQPVKYKTATHHLFYIYTEPNSKFTVTNIDNGLAKTNQKNIRVHFNLKNAGNVDGLYHLAFQNEKLELDHRQVIPLRAGRDSAIEYVYTINKKNWQQFTNETIRITVADSLYKKENLPAYQRFSRNNGNNNVNTYYSTFDIYKVDSVFSMHSSDHPYFRLGLETGLIGSSRQVSYYGAVRVDYDISKHSRFYFNYRSRQFGLYNTIDRDVFTIGLKTRHWEFEVGKISNSKFFLTYGNGVSVMYKWKKYNSLNLFGVRHTPGFHTTNDNAGLTLKYSIKNTVISHDLLYNSDSASRIHSGIVNTDIQWRSKTVDLSINGGFGNERNSLQNSSYAKLAGGFGGYRISYKLKSWSLSSQYRMFGKRFPGLNAGSQSQYHGVSFRGKKILTELFYQLTITNNNFLKDTLYNTDILTFNSAKYGTKITINRGRSYLTVGYGWLVQKGQQAYSFTPRYQFMDMQYSFRGKKYFSVNFSSSNGYSSQKKYTTGPVFFTLNSINLNYKNIGINGGYTSVPVVDTLHRPVYHSTIYGGPYLSTHLGKYFGIGAQYSLSKTLFDDGINSFAGINMSYNNEKSNTNILVNISAPLKKADEKNANPFKYGYVSVSFRKTFNIPFPFKKKFHTLTLNFIEDENADGKAGAGEKRLSNVTFAMSGLHFITDRQGVAQYKHIEKAAYPIDFSGAELRGLIPREGAIQVINSEGDAVTTILFSKSRMLTGHIDILQDSVTGEKFLLNNIKITAMDSSGKKYSTTTDDAGDYFINLPGGYYTVMLNQAAFNELYRPDKMSREADLRNNEIVSVNFIIKQKRREIKMLDASSIKVINLKQSDVSKTDSTKQQVKPKH